MLFSLFLAGSISSPPAAPAETGPRYYVILFGGQGVPFRPRTAHTWATYVKVTPTAGARVVESRTISWMPEGGVVNPLNPLSERGRNYTLRETFAAMAGNNARVSYWGPYEIDAARYRAACDQVERLAGGGVRYRMIDTFGLTGDVSHCARAVTDADPAMRGVAVPVLRVGEPGTSVLAARYVLNGAFVGGDATHDWLVPVLGIDKHGAVKRAAGEWIDRRLW